MSLGDRARKFSTSVPPATVAISATHWGADENPPPATVARVATVAATSSSTSATPTRGQGGHLHPRLARLIQAYAARLLFSDAEHGEAVDSALNADDAPAVWAFYEAQDRLQDDRITCPMCAMLAGIRCRANGFSPDPDGTLPRRCPEYRSAEGDPDPRPASIRWPHIRSMME